MASDFQLLTTDLRLLENLTEEKKLEVVSKLSEVRKLEYRSQKCTVRSKKSELQSAK